MNQHAQLALAAPAVPPEAEEAKARANAAFAAKDWQAAIDGYVVSMLAYRVADPAT